MTKEELEKEANESLDKRLGTYAYIRKQDCYRPYVDGYTDGAEPREKQIQVDAEQIRALQKQNGELTDKVKELEKENAELKERADKADLDSVTFFSQLCKAKEHIRTLISCLIDWVQEGDKYYCYIAEAEDFLKNNA